MKFYKCQCLFVNSETVLWIINVILVSTFFKTKNFNSNKILLILCPSLHSLHGTLFKLNCRLPPSVSAILLRIYIVIVQENCWKNSKTTHTLSQLKLTPQYSQPLLWGFLNHVLIAPALSQLWKLLIIFTNFIFCHKVPVPFLLLFIMSVLWFELLGKTKNVFCETYLYGLLLYKLCGKYS